MLTCFLASAAIGLPLTLLSKTKEAQQAQADSQACLSNPDWVTDELEHLKLLRQCGVISNAEFEEEKQRLLGE